MDVKCIFHSVKMSNIDVNVNHKFDMKSFVNNFPKDVHISGTYNKL